MFGAAPDNCPECRSPDIVTDFSAGDVICRGCGFVCVTHLIDERCEWNCYANDDRGKSSLHRATWTSQTESIVDPLSTDISEAPTRSKDDMSLRKLHYQSTSSKRNHVLKHLAHLQDMAERSGLPDSIMNDAMDIFSQVIKSTTPRNKDFDPIAAACIFISCRRNNVPRTLKEISAVSGVSKKDIGRQYLQITRSLDISVHQATSSDFMTRFCSALGLTQEIQKAAEHVASQACDVISGKAPDTIAAAAIYMVACVSQFRKSSAEVSEISHVAEATIRATYKSFLPFREKLIPDFYLQKMVSNGYTLDHFPIV